MRVWWLAVVPVVGCGVLSGLDGLEVADGSADVTTNDAADDGDAANGSDASIDVGACESGTCGASAGFQPVLFASDRATLCPTGTTTNDAVVDPTAPPNACACACNYAPTCVPQANTFQWGLSTCGTALTVGQIDGGCDAINNNLGTGSFHMSMGPLSPVNACTNAATPTGQAITPPGRVCTFANCSACPTVAGFALCYAKSGDVSCPSGMTKHSVGTGASLACGACTTCTSTAKCKGTVELFDDNQCNSSLGTLQVDGTCQAYNLNKTINAVKYTPSVDQGTCTPGTSVASVGISAQTTVCCP